MTTPGASRRAASVPWRRCTIHEGPASAGESIALVERARLSQRATHRRPRAGPGAMSDISVIGLGNMGAALASSLVGAGLDVTVWNRSPGRTAPLAARGATAAPDARAALLASPRTLVCIADYPATTRLLDEAATNLYGRTLVQLSTGTPRQAADFDARVRALGGRYLDGAIMVNPTDIGSAGAQILIAGPRTPSPPASPRCAGSRRPALPRPERARRSNARHGAPLPDRVHGGRCRPRRADLRGGGRATRAVRRPPQSGVSLPTSRRSFRPRRMPTRSPPR